MSARQNKKQRKGRGNVHQRERTVTTLTENPNTPYLVPTPSEEPAGAPLPFNNPKMQNIQMASPFQMGGSYQYGSYPPFNPMHPSAQQQQQQPQQQQKPFFGPSQQQQLSQQQPLSQQQQPLPQHQQPQPLPQPQQQPQQQSQPPSMKPTLPPGKNDLDILQNLKKIIKDGQHPFFRAVPQPAALASIYLGTIPSQSQAQGRPGETPGDSTEGQSAIDTNGVSAPVANDTGTRQLPRMQPRTSDLTTRDYISPSDSRPNPLDSRPQLDSRGVPGNSQGQSVDSRSERVVAPASTSDRIVPSQSQAQPPAVAADTDDIQSSRSSSLRPADTANQNLSLVASPSDGGGKPDMPNSPRPSLKDRLVPPRSAGRATSEHPSHFGDYSGPHARRPKFYKERGGGGGGASSYRDFSPPLGEVPRGGDRGGRPAPFPPSPGRPPPSDISGRRGEWQYQQYPPSSGIPQNWDVDEGWDRPGDRDRFERDVPPRSAGWEYRGEREFIARGAFSILFLWRTIELTYLSFLDDYSSAPPLDDRNYALGPPNRDVERGRLQGPYTPPYGRVRPRTPSPMRRTGPASIDDSRPVMKRPREDFPPSGYYPPHVPPVSNRDGPGVMRRLPGEYPPPRSASSGPPPSPASFWPPPSSASSAGGPSSDRDRDYRMGWDGMDFPPPAGYDRPSPPARHYGRDRPSSPRHYVRGGGPGYGRGDPRDRGGYGRP